MGEGEGGRAVTSSSQPQSTQPRTRHRQGEGRGGREGLRHRRRFAQMTLTEKKARRGGGLL